MDNNNHLPELLDGWVQVRNISPNRPPTFNPDNCSCSEAGTTLNDPHLCNTLVNGINGLCIHQEISHDITRESFPYHQAPTVSTDDGSVRAPEGPERRDPNMAWVTLAPESGLGEEEHRRRVSFYEIETQLDYPLRRWMATLTPEEMPYHDAGQELDGTLLGSGGRPWVRCDTHFMGPTGGGGHFNSDGATKGSTNRTMQSSGHTGSTGSSGYHGADINPTEGVGHWMEASVIELPGMLMIDESVVDDDEEAEEEDDYENEYEYYGGHMEKRPFQMYD